MCNIYLVRWVNCKNHKRIRGLFCLFDLCGPSLPFWAYPEGIINMGNCLLNANFSYFSFCSLTGLFCVLFGLQDSKEDCRMCLTNLFTTHLTQDSLLKRDHLGLRSAHGFLMSLLRDGMHRHLLAFFFLFRGHKVINRHHLKRFFSLQLSDRCYRYLHLMSAIFLLVAVAKDWSS